MFRQFENHAVFLDRFVAVEVQQRWELLRGLCQLFPFGHHVFDIVPTALPVLHFSPFSSCALGLKRMAPLRIRFSPIELV